MDSPDLRAPQHYINRELSFLEFNQRVLDQAFDESVPLLERLKFLCISCSNLDEFFEIRVAGLKQLQELGGAQLAADGMSIPEQLTAIHDRATRLVADQYRCLNSLLLPALAAEGVPLLGPAEWTAQQGAWLEQYFEREVEPVLSPLGLDPARPFPRIQNKSLNFIVRLEGKDAFEDRKSTRLNSSHSQISYAVFCLKKKISTILLQPHIAQLCLQIFLPHTAVRTAGIQYGLHIRPRQLLSNNTMLLAESKLYYDVNI